MEKKAFQEIISLIFRAMTLAMGVAVATLSCLDKLDTNAAFTMLGIGLACAGIALLEKK